MDRLTYQLLIERMDRFQKRAELLNGLVDGIHLTDSVLGIPRVSGIVTADHLSMNRKLDTLPVTCTSEDPRSKLLIHMPICSGCFASGNKGHSARSGR